MGLAIQSFQGTSLAYSISVNELMSQSYQVSTITFDYLAVYAITGLIYVAIAVPATWLSYVSRSDSPADGRGIRTRLQQRSSPRAASAPLQIAS